MGRKHCGKERNSSLRAISPFPTVFSKHLYCRQVKTMACLGKFRTFILLPAYALNWDKSRKFVYGNDMSNYLM